MPGTRPSALHKSWEIKALCKPRCPQAKTCHNPFPVLTNPSSPAFGVSSHLRMLHFPDLPVPSQVRKACILLWALSTKQQLLPRPFESALSKPFAPLPFPKGVFLNPLIKLGPHGQLGNSNHLLLLWAAHSQDCPRNDTAICERGCRAIPHLAHPPQRLPCQRVTCSSARKGLAAGAATVLTLPSWSLAALRCNQAPPIHHISLQCLGRQSLAKVLEGGKKALN